MAESGTLQDMMEGYRAGTISREAIAVGVYEAIRRTPFRYSFTQRDEAQWQDFCCWLFPRIQRTIDRYEEKGSSFDAYVHAMVHWSSREYRIRDAEHRCVEKTVWKERALERELVDVGEKECVYATSVPVPLSPLKNSEKKLLLMLAMKCALELSDRMAEKMEKALGIGDSTLIRKRDALRALLQRNEERKRDLLRSIDVQYCRTLSLQNRSREAPDSGARRIELLQMAERSAKKLDNLRRRLKAVRLQASNLEVAKILGIPKGTVDSAMATFRKAGTRPFPRSGKKR